MWYWRSRLGIIKKIIFQTAPDSEDEVWDNAPHLFFDNKSAFKHNMTKLNSFGTTIANLTETHSIHLADKQDSTEYDGLTSQLYL